MQVIMRSVWAGVPTRQAADEHRWYWRHLAAAGGDWRRDSCRAGTRAAAASGC